MGAFAVGGLLAGLLVGAAPARASTVADAVDGFIAMAIDPARDGLGRADIVTQDLSVYGDASSFSIASGQYDLDLTAPRGEVLTVGRYLSVDGAN